MKDHRKILKNGLFFRSTSQGKKHSKFKSSLALISMDRKLNYQKFVLCKKPCEKRPIRGEITCFPKVLKLAFFHFLPMGDQTKILRNGLSFRSTSQGQKHSKFKSSLALISMDRKINYQKFVLCKKPSEERPIRGGITCFPKVSKFAIFALFADGGPKENLEKWPIFEVNFPRSKTQQI